MEVQVIYCHPLPDSYNHALFRTIVATLEQRGHQVTATDLYREGFDPVMTPEERRGYYERPYVPAVSTYADQLRNLEAVIFCFPSWWFSMPAMLKGYFDRIWAPGVAFEHDLQRGGIKPLLTHIKVFGVVTTYGAPWLMARFLAGDPNRKIMMRAIKPMCGAHVRSFYLAHYDMDRSTPSSRDAFLERVRSMAARL